LQRRSSAVVASPRALFRAGRRPDSHGAERARGDPSKRCAMSGPPRRARAAKSRAPTNPPRSWPMRERMPQCATPPIASQGACHLRRSGGSTRTRVVAMDEKGAQVVPKPSQLWLAQFVRISAHVAARLPLGSDCFAAREGTQPGAAPKAGWKKAYARSRRGAA
jgi:hypothetical protein